MGIQKTWLYKAMLLGAGNIRKNSNGIFGVGRAEGGVWGGIPPAPWPWVNDDFKFLNEVT